MGQLRTTVCIPRLPLFACMLLRFRLLDGAFSQPRHGKRNDQAHPPIHPTAYAGNLSGDDKKIYEYVTRRFLACCSQDAEGLETTVTLLCGEEVFAATGDYW